MTKPTGLERLVTWTRDKAPRVGYAYKHTIPAYLDVTLSLPIWTAQAPYRALAKFDKRRAEKYQIAEASMLERSEIAQLREKLRAKADTQATAEYLGSYSVGTPVYLLSGIPLATGFGAATHALGGGLPDTVEKGIVATLTYVAQCAVAISSLNVAHAVIHPEEFHTDGEFRVKNVVQRTWDTAKAFAVADLLYGLVKGPLHTGYMLFGVPDAEASVLADKSLIPLWYAVAVLPIAFAYGTQGFIKNKTSTQWNASESATDK